MIEDNKSRVLAAQGIKYKNYLDELRQSKEQLFLRKRADNDYSNINSTRHDRLSSENPFTPHRIYIKSL